MPDMLINDIPGLSAPAKRALAGVGITTLDDIAGWSEPELLRLHGFGPKAVRILEPILKNCHLSFKP